MSNDYNEAIALLTTLWQGEGFGEIRVLNDTGALRPYWLPLPLRIDHLAPALSWAYARNAEGCNVYFGVHPRATRRGRNVDVIQYRCLIADLDKPDISWPLYDQLVQTGYPASICVRTPRGMHLYWLLREPESVSVARSRMQKLQAAIKSDAVHDPARILRLPGAVCHKTEAKTPVYVCWIDPQLTYTSEAIDNAVSTLWPDVKVDTTEYRQKETSEVSFPLSVDESWVSDFAKPWIKGERSQHCLSFLHTALLHGWPDAKILETILGLPIGGHYLDRGRNGQSSFEYDLEKTKRSVYQELQYSFRVMIESAGLITNPDGTRKLKLRLKPYTQRYTFGVGFNAWIAIPETSESPHLRRLLALLSSVGLSSSLSNDAILDSLPGKCVRIIMHDDSQTVARFLPDVG